jgi:hypothetical protein
MKNSLKHITLLAVFAGMFFLAACKKNVPERLQILIQNRTDSLIHVRLYPNEKFIRPGYGFIDNDFGGSGSRDTRYLLYPNDGNRIGWNETIYNTGDLNIEPYTLATKVFDSIYISFLTDKDSVAMIFTHDTVIGYSENIFSKNSTWDLKIVKLHRSDGGPAILYRHAFLISKDKIIIE